MNNLNNCSGDPYAIGGTGDALPLKKILFPCLNLVFVFFMTSCGSSYEELKQREEFAKQSMAMTDSLTANFPGLHIDTVDGITHHFVRTADLKLRVKNVLETTNKIEDLALANGGYISKSQLHSTTTGFRSVRTKKDSLLETTTYLSTSTICLRIPSYVFDSVVRQVTAMGLFVDLRRQEADDVKIKLYANTMAEKRLNNFGKTLEKKVSPQHKLNQISDTEENILQKQMLADAKRIDSYTLADKVNYSTVFIELYQTQQIISFTAPISPETKPYEASFREQITGSFMSGLDILRKMVLFFINCWSLILLGVLSFLIYRKLKSRPVHR